MGKIGEIRPYFIYQVPLYLPRFQGKFTFSFLLSLCLCAFAFSTAAQAPNSRLKTLRAERTDTPPRLDGVLDEEVWHRAQHVDQFTQRELTEGASVSERTEVAVVYTKNALYIGAWCYDNTPDGIRALEYARDFNNALDDDFQVLLDTYNDDRNGFLFITNPIAARRDAQILNNGDGFNQFWNGVWNVATTRTDSGWFAEFRIPFITLKYPDQGGEQVWGINFERNIRRKREEVRWRGWQRDYSFRQVNQAGQLTGLKDIRSGNFVELKPYAIGGRQWNSDGETQNRRDNLGDIGGDINYLVTPNVRANLTVNTDFAQVEVDRQQINLTRFPLFFPERREFFLEGQDYFDMGFGGNRITPFYSRRIGLNEQREEVPILAGGRILGKLENSTLGFMSIQTASQENQASTNYTVGSWRQDVLRQSTVGIMTVNQLREGRYHTTTGVNGKYATSQLFGDKNLNLSGAYIQTANSGQRFRADAHALRVQAQYPNDKLSIFTSYQQSPAPFEPEVGLERRENFQEAFATVTLQPRPKQEGRLGWIRQFFITPGTITYTFFNDTRKLQTFIYQITPLSFETRSGENFSFSLQRQAEGVEEAFTVGPDAQILPGEYWQNRYNINLSTFASRRFSASGQVDWGGYFGGKRTATSLSTGWRASRFLNFGLTYERNAVTFDTLDFTTHLVRTNLRYGLTPNLFGTLLAQWNNQQELGIFNFRLRWIPSPGKDFFFILNQAYGTDRQVLAVDRTLVIGKLIWRFTI